MITIADKELGRRLKIAREMAKMTQKRACDMLEIPKSQTLSAYERGENSPPIEVLKKISQLYHVSIDWIVFGENHKTEKKENVDYIRDLFQAVDRLSLSFYQEQDFNGNPLDSYLIRLENDYLSGFKNLIQDLCRLYEVRDVLDREDFETLVQKKINDRARKSNNYEFVFNEECEGDEGELPF